MAQDKKGSNGGRMGTADEGYAQPSSKGRRISRLMERTLRRLAIIDDSDPQISRLVLALNEAGYFCQRFRESSEFLGGLNACNCEVVITSLAMPDQEGLVFLSTMKRLRPDLPVVVLGRDACVAMAVRAMQHGAVDFLDGRTMDNLGIVERIAALLAKSQVREECMPDNLTSMEKVVLKHVLLGLRNGQIAQRLGLSVRTIEDHRGNATKKLEVDDPVELVRHCIKLGILRIPVGAPANTSQFTSAL